MVTNWSRSKSNFYALIGQNSTGEFTPIIYEVSWNLFTLTAEDDRVLCQLVMFFTVFSPRCTKCNTAAIKRLLLFMDGLFIGFLVEKCVAFGWHRFLFYLFWCVKSVSALKSTEQHYDLALISHRETQFETRTEFKTPFDDYDQRLR